MISSKWAEYLTIFFLYGKLSGKCSWRFWKWMGFIQTGWFKNKFWRNFFNIFSIFPKDILNKESVGFDAGCGSGRWAKFVAPKVKKLICIDPSKKALDIAKTIYLNFQTAFLIVLQLMMPKLQRIHKILDIVLECFIIFLIQKAMKSCVSKLKKNAPLLVYLYYRFDNKPIWFRGIWICTDLIRRIISKMPFNLKVIVTKSIAITVYFPLAKLCYLLEYLGLNTKNIPLSQYRNHNFYVMETDALDRFGTKLEKRFTKKEIKKMMNESGLSSIEFREDVPYWTAIGYKK